MIHTPASLPPAMSQQQAMSLVRNFLSQIQEMAKDGTIANFSVHVDYVDVKGHVKTVHVSTAITERK